MLNEGIISQAKKVIYSSPIVVVKKKNNSIRICGYFQEINKGVDYNQYPLAKIKDLFSSITEKLKFFSKIDLKQAYVQILLTENSKRYTTISTHIGCFYYNYVPFELCSAPLGFQKMIDTITRNLPGTLSYMDDILVYVSSQTEMKKRLNCIFRKLFFNGLKINLDKCEIGKPSVEWLGIQLNENGIKPAEEKVS